MKFSIVTPSFNQGRFIERTLRSVAAQEGVEFEHVVFDGGSTDETVEVLSGFRPAVKWVSRKDGGQADAVNQGILATSGEIIGWLNSDDTYQRGAFGRVAAYFDEHPEIDVVYGRSDHIDVDDQAFEEYPTEAWSYERLKETCFISQPALFFRRRVVEEHGLLDGSLQFCMDYEFWLRIASRGARFGYLEEKLACSRVYAETKTLGFRPKVFAEAFPMLRRSLGRVPDRWLVTYAQYLASQRRPRGKFFLPAKVVAYAIQQSLKWNRSVSPKLVAALAPRTRESRRPP